MNATELAKLLDAEIVRTVKLDILHHDAAEMIRSQADEIKRLGDLCEERGSNEARLFIRCREMADQIGQLHTQKDELLAALKLIRASQATACSHEYCKGIARAAVAKAEGGAA